MQLKQHTDRSNDLSEQFNMTKSRLQDLESQSEEKDNSISSLTQEVERLKQEVKVLSFIWFMDGWMRRLVLVCSRLLIDCFRRRRGAAEAASSTPP